MTFEDIQRPVVVCGLECRDRLHALQRIMEHEIVHLTELLVWGQIELCGTTIQGAVQNIFGHPSTKNTTWSRRVNERQCSTASRWAIPWNSSLRQCGMSGAINRIHHRATVLVEASDGLPYSDGKRYKKFYVPLPMLKDCERSTADPRSECRARVSASPPSRGLALSVRGGDEVAAAHTSALFLFLCSGDPLKDTASPHSRRGFRPVFLTRNVISCLATLTSSVT